MPDLTNPQYYAQEAVLCYAQYLEMQELVNEYEKQALNRAGNKNDASVLLRDNKGYKDAVGDRNKFMTCALLASNMAVMLRSNPVTPTRRLPAQKQA